ncbi:MAG: hypothetical protein M5U28_23340 [Sandaracinaceae bacterium]|nr:hypothetical protein [Sandaracinaceae bacterium]
MVPRAFISGAIVTLAVATVLTYLAGGFGLMSFDTLSAEALRPKAVGLGVWMAIAWVVAAGVGGFVAGLGAQASHRTSGAVHGFVSWALACVVGGALLAGAFLIAIPVGLASVDAVDVFNGVGAHWGFFLSDIGAAIVAILAGDLAVRRGRKEREEGAALGGSREEAHPA